MWWFWSQWRYIKIVLPCILVLMLLMRLVWMQRRSYTIETDLRAQATISSLSAAATPCQAQLEEFRPRLAKVISQSRDLFENESVRAWLSSPVLAWLWKDRCPDNQFEVSRIVRSNQWIWVATVFFASLGVRLVTGSWFWTLAAATILMSRGRLIGSVGYVSAANIIMLYLAVVFSAAAHFIRSGFMPIYYGVVAALIGAVWLETSLWVLPGFLALSIFIGPLLRQQIVAPAVQRIRTERRRQKVRRRLEANATVPYDEITWFDRARQVLGWSENSYATQREVGQAPESGGFLRPMASPFFLWALQRRRWGRLVSIPGMGLVISALVVWSELPAVDSFTGSFSDLFIRLTPWLTQAMAPVDFHYTASLMLIITSCCIRPTDGHPGFWELCVFTLTMTFGCMVGAWFCDFIDFIWFATDVGNGYWKRAAHALLWTETLVITMGMAAAVHLVRVIDQRLQRR